MHCDQARQQLNALTDGELGRWQTWQIQRHLRRCADCTDELAAIRQLGEQARTWRAAAAPANLQARIMQTLMQSQAEGSVLSLSNEENLTMQPFDNSMMPSSQIAVGELEGNGSKPLTAPRHIRLGWNWRPIAVFSGLGVMAILLALFLLPTRKSFAFADVLTAMQNIRTIHWTVKANGFNSSVPTDDESKLTVMEAWARLDKPAYALLAGPNGEVKTLMVPGKQSTFISKEKISEMPMPWLGNGDNKENALRKFILAQLISPIADADAKTKEGNALEELQDYPVFHREDVILEGRRVVRFSSNSKFGEGRFLYSLWVDPETRLIVRSETQMPNPVKGQPDLVSIAAQFRYNEEPPAGIFDIPTK